MTKENGQTIAWADYDAWGKPRSPVDFDMNLAGVDNAVSFTSYTYDVVLDLYFAQARFYDQNDRRFISVDPIKDGINRYAYCGNNPIVFVDPSGLKVSYILYTTGKDSNFTQQANWQEEQLKASGDTVVKLKIDTVHAFNDAWNDMDGEINQVFIYSHGNARTLILKEGSGTDALSIDGENRAKEPIGNLQDLETKAIAQLHIMSCNAGNIDYFNHGKEGENVASVMAGKNIGGVTWAYDGNVSFGKNWFDAAILGNYPLCLSNNQASFYAYAEEYKTGSTPLGRLLWTQTGVSKFSGRCGSF